MAFLILLFGGDIMEYRLYSKDIQLTDAIKNYLDKKFEKVDRVLKSNHFITSTEVRFTKERNLYSVEILSKVSYKNTLIKVSEKGEDLYEVIDRVTDSFERKVKQIKDKFADSRNWAFEQEIEYESISEGDVTDEIKTSKRVDLLVLSIEEAILQMKTLNHEFLLFRNSETDELNLLYKDKNGGLHLLEFNE